MSSPYVIGVTGGIGSGKSAVCREFERHGITIVDADIVSREVVEPGSAGLGGIIEHFGTEVLNDDGTLDRGALRRIVFADDNARVALENILHPKIRDRIKTQIESAIGPYVLLCVPLLIERGNTYAVDRILVIDCPRDVQIARVMARDNSTAAEVEAILATQATREERLAAADDVIENKDTIEKLREQVNLYHKRYLKLASASS